MTVYRAAIAAREALLSPVYAHLSDSASHLWLALTTQVNGAGECDPGVPRLAKLIRRSERTVRRARAELVDAGAIRVTFSDGGKKPNGNPATNVYRLPLATVPQYPQPGHGRQGYPSTTRSPATRKAVYPVTRDRSTRSPVSAKVELEVEVEKRSTTAKRRRVVSSHHRTRMAPA